jgi:hypothetical protein
MGREMEKKRLGERIEREEKEGNTSREREREREREMKKWING